MSCGASEPDRDCALCPRLEAFRAEWRRREPVWFNAPVPSFGPATARLLIVGLAPGPARRQSHRAAVHRRSCRRAVVRHAEPLRICRRHLRGAARRRARARRCPHHQCGALRAAGEQADRRRDRHVPGLPQEHDRRNAQSAGHRRPSGGSPTTRAAAALEARRSEVPFAHGAAHAIGGMRLFDSYHCSRYNTNTGVLTPEMFHGVFAQVRDFLSA